MRNGIQMSVATFGDLPAGEFQLVSETGELIAIAHAVGTIVAYDCVIPHR